MTGRIRRIQLFAAVLLFVVSAGSAARAEGVADDDSAKRRDPSEDATESRPIENGYFFLNGEYLPPPYVIRRQGDSIWINDRSLQDVVRQPMWPARSAWRRPRGPWPRPGERFPPGEPPSPPAWWWVERTLESGSAILASDGSPPHVVLAQDHDYFFGVLFSDRPREKKVEDLAGFCGHRTTPEHYAALVDRSGQTPALWQRVEPLVTEFRRIAHENETLHEQLLWSDWLSRPGVRYTMTLLAMGLSVLSFGSLLRFRPEGRGSWREVGPVPEGPSLVIRNVTLLAILGVFDLTSTAVAQQAGGFFELNPIGEDLVADPFLLAGFKMTTLLLSCSILVYLRRYRGAQVASWWMCLICTIVAFRWLTYNSMFLS